MKRSEHDILYFTFSGRVRTRGHVWSPDGVRGVMCFHCQCFSGTVAAPPYLHEGGEQSTRADREFGGGSRPTSVRETLESAGATCSAARRAAEHAARESPKSGADAPDQGMLPLSSERARGPAPSAARDAPLQQGCSSMPSGGAGRGPQGGDPEGVSAAELQPGAPGGSSEIHPRRGAGRTRR